METHWHMKDHGGMRRIVQMCNFMAQLAAVFDSRSTSCRRNRTSAEQDPAAIPLQVEVEVSVEKESVHIETDSGRPIPESLAEESSVLTHRDQEWPDHFLP